MAEAPTGTAASNLLLGPRVPTDAEIELRQKHPEAFSTPAPAAPRPTDDTAGGYQQRIETRAASATDDYLRRRFPEAFIDDAGPSYELRRAESAGSAAYASLKAEYPDSPTDAQASDGSMAGDMNELARSIDALPPEARAAMTAGRVARDVGRGLIEMPGQIIGGMRDAAQETIDLWIQAGNWLESKAPITRMLGAENAGTAESPQLPQPVGPADSATGKLVHDITQFVTGFVGAGKLRMFQALQPATRAGRTAKAMGQGAVADFTVFDEQEKRLSDLVQSVPELQNPATRFLATDPDDNAAESRFKRAVEGVLTGAALDGFVLTLKALRSARIARAQERVIDPNVRPLASDTAGEIKALLGDADSTELVRRVAPDPAAAKLAEGVDATAGLKPKDVGSTTAPETVEINFARINAPDDVKATIQQMADWYATPTKDAQRGVRTWEQT